MLKVAYSLLIDKIKIAENKMINSYWGGGTQNRSNQMEGNARMWKWVQVVEKIDKLFYFNYLQNINCKKRHHCHS